MKRWISFFGHLAIVTVLTSFGTYSFNENSSIEVPEALKVIEPIYFGEPSLEVAPSYGSYTNPVFLGKSFLGFKEALAFKESQGNYNVVNTLGYLGKYQFGSGTLRLIGVYNTSGFLYDAELQEQVFKLNVARNKWILRRDIKRFVGKRINGVVISESGIVAAAHLAGAGNVKKYLRSYGKVDFADAYGSSIAYYMGKFSGYDISAVKPYRNPKVKV
ncbi:hypothetical protein [uncultured Croceitalea sp.]|uniref:hypothetical protein n=1 Tax=uncultured Croceitalea sp. TaxID=1798908 RepID=UPI003305669A